MIFSHQHSFGQADSWILHQTSGTYQCQKLVHKSNTQNKYCAASLFLAGLLQSLQCLVKTYKNGRRSIIIHRDTLHLIKSKHSGENKKLHFCLTLFHQRIEIFVSIYCSRLFLFSQLDIKQSGHHSLVVITQCQLANS